MKKSYENSVKDMNDQGGESMEKLSPIMKKNRVKKGPKAYMKKMSDMGQHA